MVLEWLGGSKDADALIAPPEYPQAVTTTCPHVRQVLEDFDLARAMKTAEGA